MIVVAKKRKLIPAVTPLLDTLVAKGFHMGDNLYRTAQKLAGED
jgi:predicted nucleic acid-binding protein